MTDSAFAFGLGVGTHNSKGEWLEVFFARPLLAPPATLVKAVAGADSGAAMSSAQLEALQEELASAGLANRLSWQANCWQVTARWLLYCCAKMHRRPMCPRATSNCTCCRTGW